MRIAYHVMSSPVGLLFLARTEAGLRYLHFMDRRSLKRTIAAFEPENPGAHWNPSLLGLKPFVDQLDQYFSGDRKTFSLPLDLVGSDFQRQVWGALSAIPYGETRSYAEIARVVGQPRAARAVGLANNQNPVAIIVPCHRVVGAGGALVGYGGGLQRKRWLLDHEARFAPAVGRTRDLFAAERAGGALVAATAADAMARSAPRGAREVPAARDSALAGPARISRSIAQRRRARAVPISPAPAPVRPARGAVSPSGSRTAVPGRAAARRRRD
jgi:methylated-DNA-[protein]-cysteine S-methyltransferase